MKVHLLQVLVVDHDDLGAEEVKLTLEETKFPNWCIFPQVVTTFTHEVDWSEDHPLNRASDLHEAVAEEFESKCVMY